MYVDVQSFRILFGKNKVPGSHFCFADLDSSTNVASSLGVLTKFSPANAASQRNTIYLMQSRQEPTHHEREYIHIALRHMCKEPPVDSPQIP
jgi:hypothetical protein